MDEVTIRPASLPEDLDQICELYAETVDWHAENWPDDFRKVDVRESVREDLSRADGTSGLYLFVAEAEGGRIAGLVAARTAGRVGASGRGRRDHAAGTQSERKSRKLLPTARLSAGPGRDAERHHALTRASFRERVSHE
ncbi:GNAT family N-acetyltransferase [Kribbella sp. NPDC059898]|uniref:GNAT family N-acetyltransferase n=1 Tax=Kribbella sp. NPDC059898 TaxID=3346995 RepID=UPI00364D2407